LNSGLIYVYIFNAQLRAKKTKESKIEEYKRRLRERHEARK
jgi:hypothetical protein